MHLGFQELKMKDITSNIGLYIGDIISLVLAIYQAISRRQRIAAILGGHSVRTCTHEQ